MAEVFIRVENSSEGNYEITVDAGRKIGETYADAIERALDEAAKKVRKVYGIDD